MSIPKEPEMLPDVVWDRLIDSSAEGRRVAIVNSDYREVSSWAEEVQAIENSSSGLLRAVLNVVPVEGAVTLMATDIPGEDSEALVRFREAIQLAQIRKEITSGVYLHNLPPLPGVVNGRNHAGFYNLVNNIDTLFLRTGDRLNACASFVIAQAD